MSDKSNALGRTDIYDARSLGTPKVMILGLQHMFAMFGSTVLVPMLTGLDVSTTLLFAGLGTLLFHLLTKGKVPAFLGSSFAFLGGYMAIAPMLDKPNKELLPYACFGVACAGLLYLVLALLIKLFGTGRVMKFFPPIVTGPIIIAIGLTLSPSAINNCSSDWLIALTAILLVIICNIWGKGMVKIVPIIIGVLGSYLLAAALGGRFDFIPIKKIDFSPIWEAAWVGLPIHWNDTVFSLLGKGDAELLITSLITIMPIALATMVEHIGDISAISSTVGKNYIKDPAAPGIRRPPWQWAYSRSPPRTWDRRKTVWQSRQPAGSQEDQTLWSGTTRRYFPHKWYWPARRTETPGRWPGHPPAKYGAGRGP